MAKRWTKEEDELILKLRAEGFTSKEMVSRLEGRTHGSIRMRLTTISEDNLRKPWTDEEKEKAIELKKKGRTYKHIALQLDRTVFAVQAFFNRLNNS